MNLNFDELRKGQPLKTKPVEETTVDQKFYRLGFQQAKLEADKALHEQQKALTMQELEAARQSLMSMQVQQAAQAAALGGTQAGIAAGMGMAGMPMDPSMQGGMPPGPPPGMMPPQGASPGGAPPPAAMDIMGAYSQSM